MRRRIFIVVWFICLLSYTVGRAQEQLVVFAAASLTDVFEAIAEAFEEEYPNVEILFNFGGSSTLAAQIVQGAPADVFASANPQQMAVTLDEAIITTDPITFAENRLVLIVPSDNPAGIASIADLATDVDLILAAPDVPIRAYSEAVLDALVTEAEFGDLYREAVLDNLVSEEPNVRQVVAKIALGEADAGIVYASDVTPDIAESVQIIDIPEAINILATYPIAIIDESNQPEVAAQFVEFVLSEAGQAILVEWGFVSIMDELNGEIPLEPEATDVCDPCGD